MKILRKIIVLIHVLLIIFSSTNATQINAFASSTISATNGRIANVAVLLYSFDDIYMLEIKQSLENIENEDKVKFTFYDGKNNISLQNGIDNIVTWE